MFWLEYGYAYLASANIAVKQVNSPPDIQKKTKKIILKVANLTVWQDKMTMAFVEIKYPKGSFDEKLSFFN